MAISDIYGSPSPTPSPEASPSGSPTPEAVIGGCPSPGGGSPSCSLVAIEPRQFAVVQGLADGVWVAVGLLCALLLALAYQQWFMRSTRGA